MRSVRRIADLLVLVGPSGCGKSTIIQKLQREFPDVFSFSISHTTRQPRTGEENGREYHFVSKDQFEALLEADGFIEYTELQTSSSSSSSGSVSSHQTSTATTTAGEGGRDGVVLPREGRGSKGRQEQAMHAQQQQQQKTDSSSSKEKERQSMNYYGTSKRALGDVLRQNKVVLMDTDVLGAVNIRRFCEQRFVPVAPLPSSSAVATSHGAPAANPKATPSAGAAATTASTSPSSSSTPWIEATDMDRTRDQHAQQQQQQAASAHAEGESKEQEKEEAGWRSCIRNPSGTHLPPSDATDAKGRGQGGYRPLTCKVLFIQPPSMQELAARLRARKSESEASLVRRLRLGEKWMMWADANPSFFDHRLVNDDLEQCYSAVRKIVLEEVVALGNVQSSL